MTSLQAAALIIFVVLAQANGEFTLRFQFHRYSNPSRRAADGNCCDWVFGCRSCETLFTSLCIRRGSIPHSTNGQCIAGTNRNPGRVGDDTVEFGATIGSLSNPFTAYTGSSIPQEGYQLYLVVYDDDSVSNDDLIDRIIVPVPGRPSSVQSSTYTGRYRRASLVLSYTLSCNQHYYGTDCSVNCVPQNTVQNGHYTCNSTTGAKICRDGWQNTANNCRDVSCHLVCQSPGGQCTSNGVCQCSNGWSGVQCDVPQCKVGCHPQGGYCLKPNQCLCRTNWNGTNCDRPQCSVNCSAIGGQCTSPTECTCLTGYTGQACEIDLLPCDHQIPCKNEATCSHTDTVGEYNCICQNGYTGRNCEIDIDECSEDPCYNNGTCINGDPGTYRCICTSGWSGQDCNVSIDYCESSPCTNNGTCTNLRTGHYCHCPTQYEGLNCELSVNACLPDPCQNNGTCMNLITNYTCTCIEGYSGYNCDYMTSTSSSYDINSSLFETQSSSYTSQIIIISTNVVLNTRSSSMATIRTLSTIKSSSTTIIKTKLTTISTSTTIIKRSSTSTLYKPSPSIETLQQSSSIVAPIGGGISGLLVIIVVIIISVLVLACVLRQRSHSKTHTVQAVNDYYYKVTDINGGTLPTILKTTLQPSDYEEPRLLREVTNTVYDHNIETPDTNNIVNGEGIAGPFNNPVYCETGEHKTVQNPVYGGDLNNPITNPVYGGNTLETREEYKTISNPLYGGSTLEREGDTTSNQIIYTSIPNPVYGGDTLERPGLITPTITPTNNGLQGNPEHTYEQLPLSPGRQGQRQQLNNYDYIELKTSSTQPPLVPTASSPSHTYDYIKTTTTTK